MPLGWKGRRSCQVCSALPTATKPGPRDSDRMLPSDGGPLGAAVIFPGRERLLRRFVPFSSRITTKRRKLKLGKGAPAENRGALLFSGRLCSDHVSPLLGPFPFPSYFGSLTVSNTVVNVFSYSGNAALGATHRKDTKPCDCKTVTSQSVSSVPVDDSLLR
jgi:hypothetical protein